MVRCEMTKKAREGKTQSTIRELLYTDEFIASALERWAEFENGRREARLDEGEIAEQRDRELEWAMGDLE